MGTEFARRVSLLGLVTVVAGAAAFVYSPPPSVVSFFGVLGVGYGFGALTAGLYAYLGAKIPAASRTPEEGVAGGGVPEASEDGTGADATGGPGSAAGASDGGFVYAAETSLVGGEAERAVVDDDGPIDAEQPDVARIDGPAEDGVGPSGVEDGSSSDGTRPSGVEAGSSGDGTASSGIGAGPSSHETGQFTFFVDAGTDTSGDGTAAEEAAGGKTSWDVDEDPDTDDPGAASPGESDDGGSDGEDTFVLGEDEFVVEGSTER